MFALIKHVWIYTDRICVAIKVNLIFPIQLFAGWKKKVHKKLKVTLDGTLIASKTKNAN